MYQLKAPIANVQKNLYYKIYYNALPNLVGGISTPSKKYESVRMIIFDTWKNVPKHPTDCVFDDPLSSLVACGFV